MQVLGRTDESATNHSSLVSSRWRARCDKRRMSSSRRMNSDGRMWNNSELCYNLRLLPLTRVRSSRRPRPRGVGKGRKAQVDYKKLRTSQQEKNIYIPKYVYNK